ncbi:hypothetical protein BpHYR1_045426 [Brachionus plicatilis]|uniref:Uncharacterized protein n=1 Tax=Brachionus plicatilis TaxID=10195 RepID=A0A3M7PK46_BRAPC|nr:hypothetical protein BpHYR1_045426 [Brachionus plicatilis]
MNKLINGKIFLLINQNCFRVFQTTVVYEYSIGISNHGTSAHAFIALVAYLLMSDHKFFVLTHYFVLVHLKLQCDHQTISNLGIMFGSDYPIEHIFEEL